MTQIVPDPNTGMIELEDSKENVYDNFLESMRNPETKRMYVRNLRKFLNLIPNNVFKEYLGVSPKSREIEDLAASFTSFAKKDINTTKQIIKSYVKEIKKDVEAGKISPSIVKNRIKPIKALLSANEIDVTWTMINKMFPRENKSEDRAYKKEEIQNMLEHCTDVIDKLIILMFSSAGFRLEAWDYFCWKDILFFEDGNKHYKGAALRVYRGDQEEYWTFITPETCKILLLYKEEWKSRFLRYPKDDDPLIASTRFDVPHRLRQKGVRARVDKIVTKIGLRDQLKKGNRRYQVQLDHGFRKYFNTMMRRAKVNYLDKEDMMGHSVGLERYYERYQEEDFERFPEYQKAIPFLTISEEEKVKVELKVAKRKNSELEQKNSEFEINNPYVKDLVKLLETNPTLIKKMENFEKFFDEKIASHLREWAGGELNPNLRPDVSNNRTDVLTKRLH